MPHSLDDTTFAKARQRMVSDQLRRAGIHDERVLAAMALVPREEFVPEHLRGEAYVDGPLPIGLDQTISQPFTVAFMVQSLQLEGTERVLEVGTGSGYGAAVLSQLTPEVHTIERHASLAEQAQSCLRRLKYDNVRVHVGDGAQGLTEFAPFDAICVTAAPRTLPPALIGQLASGGRLVIPIGDRNYGQRMTRIRKVGDKVETEDLGRFAFVPLIADRTTS